MTIISLVIIVVIGVVIVVIGVVIVVIVVLANTRPPFPEMTNTDHHNNHSSHHISRRTQSCRRAPNPRGRSSAPRRGLGRGGSKPRGPRGSRPPSSRSGWPPSCAAASACRSRTPCRGAGAGSAGRSRTSSATTLGHAPCPAYPNGGPSRSSRCSRGSWRRAGRRSSRSKCCGT